MPNHLIIVFVGLIAHFSLPVGSETFERAVLTANQSHSPFLVLRTADVESRPVPQGTCPSTLPSGLECYDLNRMHVTIGDLSGGYPKPFDSHIPRLTDITNGKKPLPQVQNANAAFAHAFAYVDYSGGCVRAPRLIDKEVSWSGRCSSSSGAAGGPRCVPAYTLRDGASGTDPLTLDLNGKQFKLKPDSIVFVANISDQHVGADYKEHLWLNDGKCIKNISAPGQNCPDSAVTTSCDGTSITDMRSVKYVGAKTIDQFALTLGSLRHADLEVDCTQSQGPPPP
jgi:hypothetical protein